MLSTLEGRGWVAREKSTTDGRLVLVRMTPAGRELMTELFPAFNTQEQHVASPIEADKRAELAEMLRLLTVNVEKVD